MKKRYIKPEIDTIKFDNTDVICTSETPGETDTPDTLIMIGADSGNASAKSLMN